jgi:hypothetical protein
MVAYIMVLFLFFFISFINNANKNKYSEKETPGHFEKKVCPMASYLQAVRRTKKKH